MDAIVTNMAFAAPGTNASVPLHPYFPLDVTLPKYIANTQSSKSLVGTFVVGCLNIFVVTLILAMRTRSTLSAGDLVTTLWFALCGFIHFFFEGYFAVNHPQMASKTDTFGQLWKEYSLSDSRYLTQDPFLISMEAFTAVFWGPLSFLCAWAIIKDHPIRHPLQMMISLGQLYGDVLYFATCWFSPAVHCRPESFYFWAYFVLCNAFWIVIPGWLIVNSAVHTKRAFGTLKELQQVAEDIKNVKEKASDNSKGSEMKDEIKVPK